MISSAFYFTGAKQNVFEDAIRAAGRDEAAIMQALSDHKNMRVGMNFAVGDKRELITRIDIRFRYRWADVPVAQVHFVDGQNRESIGIFVLLRDSFINDPGYSEYEKRYTQKSYIYAEGAQ